MARAEQQPILWPAVNRWFMAGRGACNPGGLPCWRDAGGVVIGCAGRDGGYIGQ